MSEQEKPKHSDEFLIDKFIANRYRHIFSADGGQLTVTNQRLIFNPHAVNINVSPSEIAVADIMTVAFFSPLGLIPNGLVVKTKDGRLHKFTVYNRKKIAEIIKDLKDNRAKFVNETVFEEGE